MGKKIEKLYKQFIKKEVIFDYKFFFEILLGSGIIIGIVIYTIKLLHNYISVKENKFKIGIIIVILLAIFYIILFIFDALFFKKVERYNKEGKEKTNSKKFLEWLLNNNIEKENIEFKRVKTLKTSNEVICWIIRILISAGIIHLVFSDVLKIYNKSLDIIKQKDEINYILIMLLPFFLKDKIKEKLNKMKLLEKQDFEISNYVKKYFENVEVFEKILDIDVRNEELIFKDINRNELGKKEDKLKKLDYIYKNNKLIFFIKFEYLEIFLDNLVSHKYQENEKQEQLKEKIVNKINNLDYIYMNQEKIMKLVIEVK